MLTVKRLSVWILIVAVLVVGGSGAWLMRYKGSPLKISAPGYRLVVDRGSSLQSVARALGEDGVLRYPQVLALLGRLSGQAGRVQAGEYELSPGATPASLLEQLVDGRVKLHALTIIEGWTIIDLLDAIGDHAAITRTLSAQTPRELANELGLGYDHAEGLFFPDTYKFPSGTTDRELLIRAYEMMQRQLTETWESRQPGLALNDAYQALILASIVERETAMASERPEISGVFARRLEKGMRLQTDPTVIYGLGSAFDGNLTRKHLNTDGPYNTYTRNGLPPTPIALPGRQALLAAVNPAAGDTLYFVATGRDDGSHFFTATLQEHNKAVARYLAALREENNK